MAIASQGAASRSAILVLLGASSTAGYAALALGGDLRSRLPFTLAVVAGLAALAFAAWSVARGAATLPRVVLAFALLFRLVAAAGPPTLSDDVYRYVWDGRVQRHGFHPYLHAPDDPALAGLRDADWERINHRELRTIYPPLSEMVFALLAGAGAGVRGFKLAFGLVDFALVLALVRLLARAGLPADRALLYAWHPLAVIESAGSGHLEPLGVLCVVLSALWIIGRRIGLSTLALAAAAQVKLLPLALVPGFVRRVRGRHVVLLVAALAAPTLFYATNGPAIGTGLFDYAARWERNAVAFAGLRELLEAVDSGERLTPVVAALHAHVGDGVVPWDRVEALIWPDRLARGVVALAALVWLAALTLRRALGPLREALLALGGVLLLAPTLHPWYVLWVLPLAAADLAWGWLLFGALAPLAYAGAAGDVPWAVRAAEYLPPLLLALGLRVAGRRRRTGLP